MTSLSLSCIGEGNGNPLQCSYLENPRDGGAWWAAVYGVAQSQIRLKRLSSSSSNALPARLQNKGLSEYQRRLSQLQTAHPLLEAGRQAGDSQSQKARGKLGPRDGIPYQTARRLPVANQVFLGSWTVDIHQEGHSQRLAPQRRHSTPEMALLLHTHETEQLGLRGDKMHHPAGKSALAKHLVA